MLARLVARPVPAARRGAPLPSGLVLCSPARRAAAHLLDLALFFGPLLALLPLVRSDLAVGSARGAQVVTLLLFGYLVWSAIAFRHGQSPGKQLVGVRAVEARTGRVAGFRRTCYREIVAKHLIGFLLGWLILPYLWLLGDRDRQQLWDKLAGTLVVYDPDHRLAGTPVVYDPDHRLA